MLKMLDIIVTPFRQICRVLFDSDTGAAVVVDPGGDADRILDVLAREKLQCEGAWLTHSHLDHCGGVAALKGSLNIKLLAHPAESEMRRNVVSYGAMFGLQDSGMENCPEPDVPLSGGERLMVGSHEFEVLFTPGHSPGHLCYYNPDNRLLLAGDAIFAGSIGRTDLPGGSHEVLMSSIRHTILKLPADTRLASGHGPVSTVGVERKTNPFLRNFQSEEP